VASVPVQLGGRWAPASRRGPGIRPARGPVPPTCVRARARSVPAASRVPRGRAIRAAESDSAGAGPQRQGAPAARYMSAGCPGSRSSRAWRSSTLVRRSAATRGSSPAAAVGARGLVAARPTARRGAAPSRRTRNSTLTLPPGGSSNSQRSSPAEASASVGGGSAETDDAPVGQDQRRPESWTLAGSSGPALPAAMAPSAARSVPSATSRGRRRGRAAALRRVIRSVPSAWRTRSTTMSGSGPACGDTRSVPTKRARPAPVIRVSTASGSRPATQTWQRESRRRPAR